MRTRAIGLGLAMGVPVFAGTAYGNHHFIQIEQVIGGVNGDTTAQAIQIRMRSVAQNFMQAARVRAWDATGNNPILLHDMTTNVANGAGGARVLLASPNFASYNTGITPDFTLTNLIPASYLNGGRITFEEDGGTIWWSLAFGGGNYTGSNAGAVGVNDADGNFGPPFGGPLPSATQQALQFQGIASAVSTNNAANYALTLGPATFVNNAGTSGTVIPDQASTNYWDTNGTSPGAGGPSGNNPTGNWDGVAQNFNSNAAGGAGTLTAVTSALDTVVFAAGNTATGAYAVTVGGARSAAQVNVEEGFVNFSGGTLAVGTFNVSTVVTVTSAVTGGPAGSFTKTGPGILIVTSNNTYTGGTNVQAGVMEVNRLHQNNPVNITGGGLLSVVASTPTLPNHPSGSNASVSRPSAMSIANDGGPLGSRVYNGTLDLNNNDLILDYSGASPVAAIEDMLRSGYNVTGDWAGKGITSAVARADGNYVLAVADNAALAAPFGTAQGGPLFAGVDVDLTTVLVKFTHRADVNLDGLITPDDSAVFGGNYDENQPATWATGDMNYDGMFTPDDAAIFGGAYDDSLNSLPEPGALGLVGMSALAAFARKRARRA